MQKASLYKLGVLLAMLAVFPQCTKKVDGVNNNQIIEAPYSLYFSDTTGAVFSSNDGITYQQIFAPDGKPCRAICSQADDIMFIKNNLYTSTNNGVNFSEGNLTITPFVGTDCNGESLRLNQSMIINIPSWGRVCVASSDNVSGVNYFGQQVSSVGGTYNTWNFYDNYYNINDTTPSGAALGVGSLPVNVVSYTMMADGVLASLAIQPPFTATSNNYRNFYKTDSNQTDVWYEVTGGAYGAPGNLSGTPLPQSGFFSLGHYNNQLIAIDQKKSCGNGAYYSNDTGRTWVPCTGIPNNVGLYSIAAPFEEISLIGSGNGVYISNNGTGSYQTSNTGLANNTRVYGITFKENIYKNGTVKKLIYLATNTGIYQSSDMGATWIMTIAGNFTAIY